MPDSTEKIYRELKDLQNKATARDYEVRCPYCHELAVKVDSRRIYGRSYGDIYLCKNFPTCDAYVGINKKTGEPLGTMANPELRMLRKKAHKLFDRLWLEYLPMHKQYEHRSRCYAWLSIRMNIPPVLCHIAMFNIDQCERLIGICEYEIIQIPEKEEIFV